MTFNVIKKSSGEVRGTLEVTGTSEPGKTVMDATLTVNARAVFLSKMLEKDKQKFNIYHSGDGMVPLKREVEAYIDRELEGAYSIEWDEPIDQ